MAVGGPDAPSGTLCRRIRGVQATPPTAYTTSTVTRSYRLDGTLDTQAFGGSVTETLSYDAVKRPTQISLNTSGGTSTLSQTYDRGGRVTSDGRSLQGMTGDIGLHTQSFTNDGLGRVTGSSIPSSSSSTYSYDLDSDRLTRVDGATSTTFTYDWTGELYQQTISGSKTFAYDRYGNLTTAWDKSSQSITYAYDEASRPTGITPQTGSAATLVPDALDRTKTRTVGASTDTYGYLGPSTTTYETGAATTDALLDVGGSRLAVKTGSTLSWLIFDLHGSVVALCPAGSTTLSDAYRYDAWGQALASSGSATNPWRYRGLLDLSPSTNPIMLLGARFYSPSLGNFTQEDSVQGKAANPLSMNRYLYAEADPETLIDPDGHAATGALVCSPLADLCPTASGGTRINNKVVEPVYSRPTTKKVTGSTGAPAVDPCEDSQCRPTRPVASVPTTAGGLDPSRLLPCDAPKLVVGTIAIGVGGFAIAGGITSVLLTGGLDSPFALVDVAAGAYALGWGEGQVWESYNCGGGGTFKP